MKVSITIEEDKDLQQDVEELDALLREATLHISGLLDMFEQDGLHKNEWFEDAEEFWKSLREGMCGVVVTSEDGTRRACPNQVELEGLPMCQSCMDKINRKPSFTEWLEE